MGFVQKVIRVGAVMAHQAFERCAVDAPVMLAQTEGFWLFELEFVHDVFRHGAIELGKDLRRGVVQGVVQIKYPNAAHQFILRANRCVACSLVPPLSI